ncbi:dynein light chain Tctex-type 1 [Cyprinodon tularosa]|uniref:dynein light chain Tctex-type 1 n=1 Tax=Cyprinodon tularosa TaxID=77115 RepID=UPI0018E259CD|nr:dynein light chain Tctex-type 1 [Cyprinodon tularosa]
MDDYLTDEQTVFDVDDVNKIIKDTLETVIGENSYKHSRVNQWSTNVVEQCLLRLSKLGKPYKYIVNCFIMQKNGAGQQTATSYFWDNSSDGSCMVKWEKDSMYVQVSVFGLAI